MIDNTRTMRASSVCKECPPARARWIVDYLKALGWDIELDESRIMTGFDAENNPGLYNDFCDAVSKSYKGQL